MERDIVIVTPCDDFDLLRYQQIHLEVGRINDLLRRGDFDKLLVDVAECTRLDSVLLTALVGFCRSISRAAFCGVSDQVHRSLRQANLHRLWPIFANRSEAVGGLSASDWDGPTQREGDTTVEE